MLSTGQSLAASVVMDLKRAAGGPGAPGPPAAAPSLQLPQERDEVLLLFCRQLRLEDQVEELDRVLQRQQSAVVKVRRRLLDAAQRSGLHRPLLRCDQAVDA